ncbi:MAG: beta-ketoacyl-ACP synthase II [Candidatus Dadabacteria bacterium]|nr:beta-ketoacyl-ACP synthase II [Candidatus Dadabacteria bacterium]MCY4043046.1 beta-ketoacyl-ACP synthase II [Candidatus Dadabacteria bacterium]MCY4047285.1 beta-ketoacyl-ACP synthase II [Candidatus Dadabacteria bacterium]
MARRVVITGLGLITPLGIGNKETWEGVCSGRSGIGPITRFDVSGHKTRIAGELKGFNAGDFMTEKEARRDDPFIHYAVAATRLALEDSGIEVTDELSPRLGVIVASGIGGTITYCDMVRTLDKKGPSRVSPFFIPNVVTNMAAGYISIKFNARGPNCSTTTACAASGHSLSLAAMLIKNGDADAMIAGGSEAPLVSLTVAGFNVIKALSTRNDEPEAASRPFDMDRDGFILSEGAGIVILEEFERAKARGADIYAEVLGAGMSGDAHHITAPSLDGPVRCMRMALENSGLNPEDIDYINAHGTSTKLNDANETAAVKEVFGERAHKIPVSSTKSMTGHMLGAAGTVEACLTALAIKNSVIPPTINQGTKDPECDLDYVPNEARGGKLKTAISNTYGFGGTNSVIALGRVE